MGATGLAVLSAAQAGNQATSGFTQAQALKAQAGYAASRARTNRLVADVQAQDALKRGDEDADEYGRQVASMVGSQRAALAAQGVDVDAGSAADIQDLTRTRGAQGVERIRNNAWREAWGYRFQGNQAAFEGEMSGMASRAAARNTLLTGGMNAGITAGKGYYDVQDYKQKQAKLKG